MLTRVRAISDSDRSITQYVWAWVNFVNNLRCLLKILRSQQNLYAAAGRTGRDKYHLCYFGL